MTFKIIFDTEFTSWEGAEERDWSGPNEAREIVQIAALKISWPTGQIIGSLDIVAKPKLNPVLSDYFIALTGVTQARVDKDGLNFADVLKRFHAFCGKDIAGSFGHDAAVLHETAQLQNISSDILTEMQFLNLRDSMRQHEPELRINSGRLWSYFGLPKPHGADEHDALFDCHSILAALNYFRDVRGIDLWMEK